MHALTSELARHIADSSWEAVNEAVGDEAVRALVNWLGCALAGSRDAYEEAVPAPVPGYARTHEATVLGIGEHMDAPGIAALTAEGTDALAYADTQIPTSTGPAAIVGGALLPLAEALAAPGHAFVHAFVLGTEAACRSVDALHAAPSTRTPSVFACHALGAAAACAKLLGLDARAASVALASAFAEVATMNPFGQGASAAGRAARAALLAALRAGSDDARDAPSVAMPSLESWIVPSQTTLGDWGSNWLCTRLGYHAYPCALFLHPLVEACIQLKRAYHLRGRQIAAVAIRMHPSQLTWNSGGEPTGSFEAKHSVQHAAAAVLIDGEAGLAQFDGTILRNGRVKELRARIDVVADDALPQPAARVTITQPDGTCLERLVRCALGHPLRPLSDRDLSDKFRTLAGDTLATSQAERLLGLLWNVRALPDMGGIIRTTIPEDVYEPAELPGSPLIPR